MEELNVDRVKNTVAIVPGEMVLNTPNDTELGEKVRAMVYEQSINKLYEIKKDDV